jgi:antitoxin component YwqK of YwqJK toxin-antitoxin module
MRLLILLSFFCTSLIVAQNLTDENGLKQGLWSKDYPWGSPRYEGAFEDSKEIGLFKFYDQNGKIVSQRNYETPGGIATAVMYLPKGGVEALGKLNGNKKKK